MQEEVTQTEGEMHGQDLTQGNIDKQLWSLAWPMMLSVFFYTLYNLVDAYWVSKISAEAIAAVSISQITLFIMISLGFGITAGSGVLMGMNIGAKDNKEAERVLGQSFVLVGLAGIFFAIVAIIFREPLLILSGANGAIFTPALEYFTITAAGSIFFFIMIAIMFAFNAQGDTFTLTKLFALSTLLNIILDPLLIFGYSSIPALGISGAAYATLISQFVFICISLKVISGPNMMVRFRFKNLSFQWESVKKVLNIGIPASLTQVIFPLGLAAVTFITTLGFAEAGAIAFSLGFRMEFFAFLPAVGFGFGAMAIIGQSVGANNMDRAKEAFGKAMRYGFGAATVFGVLVAIGAGFITGIFTEDPLVTEYARSYMWIVALTYGFLAVAMVEAMTFQAIGRSWPGFWIFFLRFAVITIPLAYILTQVFAFSITSIWVSLVIGNLVAALVGFVWITRVLGELKPAEIPVHADTENMAL